MQHQSRSHFYWGLILIILGSLFMLDNFNYMDFGDIISTFWPVILIIIGLKIILDKRQTVKMEISKTSTYMADQGDVLAENNVFGDINIQSQSKSFSGGSVNNVFGNIHLDLSAVSFTKDLTSVYVSGVFGDIIVHLPKSVPLNIKCTAVAGDISAMGIRKEGLMPSLLHQSENYSSANQKFYIQISIVFGSISVISS